MTKIAIKPKSKTSKIKRVTFTFSATDELVYIINNLEIRLKGLSKSEIAKLALIELNNTLEIRDKKAEYIENLPVEIDDSLLKSFNSKKYTANSTEDLLNQLKN